MRGIAMGFSFDKYTRQARLKPSLLVVLPVFATVAVWLPEVWTLLGGLAAIISACGLTFLIAEGERFQGRNVEREMIAAKRWEVHYYSTSTSWFNHKHCYEENVPCISEDSLEEKSA